jgi:RNA polymerase sigma-32 factor
LRKAKEKLNLINSNDIDFESAKVLSEQFNLSEQDIVNMNSRMTIRDQSLNTPVNRDGDGSIEMQDLLVDETPSPESVVANKEEASVRHGMLVKALDQLSERERHIFTERRLKDDPLTLEKLGEGYGISRERVRQLENRAFGKVEKCIREMDTFTA